MKRNHDAGRRSHKPRRKTKKAYVAFTLPLPFLLVAAAMTIATGGAAVLMPALLTLDGVATEKAGAILNSSVTIGATAQGHPETITLTALPEGRPAKVIAECHDASECSGPLTFNHCGQWLISGVFEYAHEDPAYPGHNYVIASAIPVNVTGCEIFTDDFETGDVSRWDGATP